MSDQKLTQVNPMVLIALGLAVGLIGGVVAGKYLITPKTQVVREVKEITRDTLKNKTIGGFILNVRGTVKSVSGNTLNLEKGGDEISILVDGNTQIARYVQTNKEATGSGATYRQENLKLTDINQGSNIVASVKSGSDGSLVASDITVL